MPRILDGVSLTGLRPELVIAIMEAENVFSALGVPLVITSCVDKKHSATSLHYAGAAVDLRIWNLQDPQHVADELNKRLGVDFDVLFEKDHIHIEWQPKLRA